MLGPDEILHEREVTFFDTGGHHHDGIDSTAVVVPLASVDFAQLTPALRAWITGQITGGGGSNTPLTQVVPLDFETGIIPVGGSQTGSLHWSNLAFVIFTRIVMSVSTTCTLTFFHQPSFNDVDREFKAQQCSNLFLWEGVWAHYDETGQGNIYWRIDNTGTSDSVFRVQLKSGTLVASGNLGSPTTATSTTGLEGMTFSMPGSPLVIDHSTRYYPFNNVSTVTLIASLDIAGSSNTVINLIKNGTVVQQITLNSGQNFLTQQFAINLTAATDYFMTSIANIGTGAGYLSIQIQFG